MTWFLLTVNEKSCRAKGTLVCETLFIFQAAQKDSTYMHDPHTHTHLLNLVVTTYQRALDCCISTLWLVEIINEPKMLYKGQGLPSAPSESDNYEQFQGNGLHQESPSARKGLGHHNQTRFACHLMKLATQTRRLLLQERRRKWCDWINDSH